MPAFACFTPITSYVPVRADLQACHVCCSAWLGCSPRIEMLFFLMPLCVVFMYTMFLSDLRRILRVIIPKALTFNKGSAKWTVIDMASAVDIPFGFIRYIFSSLDNLIVLHAFFEALAAILLFFAHILSNLTPKLSCVAGLHARFSTFHSDHF